MNRDSLKAITFDAAGTLIQLAEPVGVSYAGVAKRHGIHSDPESLNAAFGTVWKRTPPPFSPDSPVSDPHEKSWWSRIVREVFEETGAALPSEEAYEIFFEELYLHFELPSTWIAVPDAKKVVSMAGKRYRCALLSNFDGRLRAILEALGMMSSFEKHFLSCEIGASKPDLKIFQTAAAELGLSPQSILHVGDDPECDGAGAHEAGFQHFRVGKTGRPIRELIDELSLA
ncbi:MAG: HAD-IA family hydrolase [Verrucomicrobiales bacterium]|nr:HAD-IA family hydrolase [Verrucomicrobiales bacterium]